MEYKPWMDLITPDDMPNDDLMFIAKSLGVKAALSLIFCSPGITLTIPKVSFKPVKDRYILKEYDGRKFTINRLAVECDVTQRYIYKLIETHLKK